MTCRSDLSELSLIDIDMIQGATQAPPRQDREDILGSIWIYDEERRGVNGYLPKAWGVGQSWQRNSGPALLGP